MEKVAGVDRTDSRARPREYHADRGQDGDQRPGPAKLRSVKEAKQDAGDDDPDAGAGFYGVGRIGAGQLGDARARRSKKRVKIAAEDGFFNKRRDQNV